MSAIDRRHAERRRQKKTVPVERRKGERRRTPRRRSPRIALEIWVEESKGKDFYLRRTSNLSEDGVCFASALPLPVGTPVVLRFTLPGETDPIVAEGEVASVGTGQDRLGVGIRFVDFKKDGQKRLQAWVRDKQ